MGVEQREGKRVLVGWQGVSLAVGLTKGALCGSGGRMPCGTAGPRAARPGLGLAGHSATGSLLRVLLSESQLPLGWLAPSPAAWRGEGLVALSQEEEQRMG